MDRIITQNQQKHHLDIRLEGLPTEIWSRITQIDELKGQWVAGARLSPQVLGRLKRSVFVLDVQRLVQITQFNYQTSEV